MRRSACRPRTETRPPYHVFRTSGRPLPRKSSTHTLLVTVCDDYLDRRHDDVNRRRIASGEPWMLLAPRHRTLAVYENDPLIDRAAEPGRL